MEENNNYRIRGTVVSERDGQGISYLEVEAWDKDKLIDDLVGSAKTSKTGRFTIKLDSAYYKEVCIDRKPDIFFKIYREKELILSTEDSFLWNVASHQKDLQIIIPQKTRTNTTGKNTSTITGIVQHRNGNPIPGIKVQLKLKSLRNDKVLSEIKSDENGKFFFHIDDSNEAYLLAAVDYRKTISGPLTVYPSRHKDSVSLIVENDKYRGDAFFKQKAQTFEPYLNELMADKDNKNVSVEDLQFISHKTNEHPVEAWRWMTANQLAAETGADAEAFYGLFSQGLPAHGNWLANHDSARFKTTLADAAGKGFISDRTAAKADDFVAKWNNHIVAKALSDKHPKLDATMGDMFRVAGIETKTQHKILNRYITNDKGVEEFWQNLHQVTGNKESVVKIQRTMQLAALTGNQMELTTALLDKISDSKTDNPVKDLARLNQTQWSLLIEETSREAGKSAVPSFIRAEDEELRVAAYSGILTDVLQQLFPTQSFFGKLAGDKDSTAFAKRQKDLVTFEKNNPSFDFKTTSTLQMKADDTPFNFSGIGDKKLLVDELMSVQRLTAYSTDYKVISALKTDGLDSGLKISQMGESAFVAKYQKDLGDKASTTYSQAVNNYAQAVAIYGRIEPRLNFQTSGTKGSPVFATADPTLRTMFGSLEQCECEHCTSVFSPAAYLADILNFLYERAKPCYNELIRRRPDIIKVELDCKNTHTPLPYVDLVNERLENLVIPTPPETSEQTTWTAKELAANPEHLRYEVYNRLKKGIYPHVLPFNLPLEEARVYLKHLGADRLKLMTYFYNGTAADSFDDDNIAYERLGLSVQQADIITHIPEGVCEEDICLWNFYGFDKENGYKPITDPLDSSKMISGGIWHQTLTSRVDVFLQQTDLRYKELISLLICDVVNPVTGKDVNGHPTRRIAIVTKEPDTISDKVLPGTCRLDLLEMQNVTAADLQMINKFLRLWRKLEWDMFDLDRALKVSTIEDLKSIAQLEYLGKELNLSIESLTALYQNDNNKFSIEQTAYTDYFKKNYPTIPSLFEKLFLDKSVINPVDPAFTIALTGSMDDHTTTILAALQLSAEDYALLTNGEHMVVPNRALTEANLKELYRNALLARKLGYSVLDFLKVRKLLSGVNPFANPLSTIRFMRKVETIKTSGFSLEEINYLLSHRYEEKTGVAPTDEVISDFFSQLFASLRAIETSGQEERKNTIAQKFSETLGISSTASRLLLHDYLQSISDETLPFIPIEEQFLADIFSLTPIEIQPQFTRNAGALPGSDEEKINHLFSAFFKLDKVSTFIKKLKLSDSDLENILINSAAYGCTDFITLPIGDTDADFDGFEVLINLVRGRDLMPLGSPGYFDILFNAIDTAEPSKPGWLDQLHERTDWNKATIEDIVGNGATLTEAGLLETNFPADFKNGGLVIRLKKCLDLLHKTGIETAVIHDSIGNDELNKAPTAIKNAARAKYDESQWAKIAKPLRDELREKQREALVAYVVARPDNSKHQYWRDTNDLYAWLLIDVEMKPITMTSRIKQAICSVQLFIDRVLLNLEHENTDPAKPILELGGDQAAEWEQRCKVYRVWEANRKIFLYPENWIEPELRDDKSPFFKELEAQLQQNELNEENVEEAFHNYLEKLDAVARLEVVGVYRQIEEETADEESIDILHVIARTYANPHQYFHRTMENNEWTAWKKMEIEIDGNHLIPVVFNRRLCLFWLFFTGQHEEQEPLDPQADSIPPPPRYWKIQIAWSEFKKNRWTAKKLSGSCFESRHFKHDEILLYEKFKSGMSMRSTLDSALDLHIHLLPGDRQGIFKKDDPFCPFQGGSFVFRDTSGDPEPVTEFPDIHYILPAELFADYSDGLLSNKKRGSGLTILQWEPVTGSSGIHFGSPVQKEILEKSANGMYKLPIPLNEKQPLDKQFFFQDQKNTFYVTHRRIGLPLIFVKPDLATMADVAQGIDEIYKEHVEIDVTIDAFNPLGAVIDPPRSVNAAALVYASKFENEFGGGLLTVDDEGVSLDCHKNVAKTKMTYRGNSRSIDIKYPKEDRYKFHTFHHANVKTFIRYLNKLGVEGLLRRSVQILPDTIDFSNDNIYAPQPVVETPYPQNTVDFDYDGAYSQYNWELFYHVPMLIACRLSADQRFAEARQWFHYIFNPTTGEGGGKERFWQFKPFYDEAGKIVTLNHLLEDQVELSKQVGKWMDDPFKPHVIARMRKSAYMRNVVMKYLDNLIGWADQLFRRGSIESINEATNLYIMCAQILGERPNDVPPRAKHNDADFDALKDDLDSFSNALVEIETFISPSAASTSPAKNTQALGQMFYFCVPRNEYLLKYWDTVADRLFKIRHSMNIEGVVRVLPLFQPPIDPAMLVRAAAAGIDLNSLLSDISSSLPHYRFSYMLQKANELCGEVKGLGGALLSALEKKDGETLALLRSTHEQELLKAILDIKEKQLDDAKEMLESSQKSLEIVQLKHKYYSGRKYMNSHEKQHLTSMQVGMILSYVQGEINLISGTLSSTPDLKVGVATTLGVTYGGSNIAAALGALGNYIGILAGLNSASGAMSSTMGGYDRRMDDWQFQASSAGKEIEQMKKQITSAEIKVSIAEKELKNQNLQMENSAEVDEFMRGKFTNKDLYQWMVGQISTVYFQSYQLAYDLAKQAQKCYEHELGEYGDASFIRFGYWDSLKKGLLSAERLQYDLRRMETSFLAQNERELELSTNISLMMLNPEAILTLRKEGKCTLVIPEALFDLDYPGHYFRRIKSVSLSLPCIAGPYTTINCTLRLIKNVVRIDTTGDDYESENYFDDLRFHVDSQVQAISTSSAQNDSGLFEVNFRDDRYLPFEGCGAFGEWQIELQENEQLRMFDYKTINDVIFHLKYTARDGGGDAKKPGTFKGKAVKSLTTLLTAPTAPADNMDTPAILKTGLELWRMFSIRHDFPNAWYRFLDSTDDLLVTIKKEHFPYLVQSRTLTFTKIELVSSANLTERVSGSLSAANNGINGDSKEAEISFTESSILEREKEANVFIVVTYNVT